LGSVATVPKEATPKTPDSSRRVLSENLVCTCASIELIVNKTIIRNKQKSFISYD